MFKVNVQYNSHNVDLVLYVVPDSRHILFGRDWLEASKLDWTEIKFRSGSVCLSHDRQLDGLVNKHQDLFDGQLVLLKVIKARVELVKGAKPVYTKPYRVSYALRPKVQLELGKLEKAGVITPDTSSDWATINPQLLTVSPPNINIDDILTDLAGGVKFSKLDLANAYNPMNLRNTSP